MTFEQNIQNWVSVDNEIKTINDKIKLLREQRNNFSSNILSYVQNNGLDNATIKINDGKLRFMQIKQQTPLTYKFINECLFKCIDNSEQVDLIMNFIKEQRDSKQITEIKRHYTLS